MKILITGGAGYVGGGVIDLLSGLGHELLVYDVLLYEESYRKNVPFVYGDIRDTAKLQPFLDWADVVIWLAALVGDPACSLNEALTLAINQDSVQYLRDHFKGRVIFMSTCSVYGAGEGILAETSSLNPLSLYARTKLACERILEGGNALIFRLGTLYGLSDEFSRVRFDLVLNTLVMRAILHGKISVFGGNQFRPMLHVRDVARGVLAGLNSKACGIFNLSCENTTIADMAGLVKKHFQHIEVEYTDIRSQDQRNYRVSWDKAKGTIGFLPHLTMEEGITELKEVLLTGRIKNSFLKRYSNYLYLKPLVDEYRSPLGYLMETGI